MTLYQCAKVSRHSTKYTISIVIFHRRTNTILALPFILSRPFLLLSLRLFVRQIKGYTDDCNNRKIVK